MPTPDGRPENPRPDSVRPESARPESVRPESIRPDSRASTFIDRPESPIKHQTKPRDYHWLTWKTTPTPQPGIPVPDFSVPNPPATPMYSPTPVPQRPKSAWSNPARKAPKAAARPATAGVVTRRIPTPQPYTTGTPEEFMPDYHDNMTSAQPPASPMNINHDPAQVGCTPHYISILWKYVMCTISKHIQLLKCTRIIK